jgi:hypothetical protein
VPVKVERHKRHLRVSQARTGSSKNFIVTSDNPNCGEHFGGDHQPKSEAVKIAPVPDWRERLVCSKCGSRQIDMVVTGTKWG